MNNLDINEFINFFKSLEYDEFLEIFFNILSSNDYEGFEKLSIYFPGDEFLDKLLIDGKITHGFNSNEDFKICYFKFYLKEFSFCNLLNICLRNGLINEASFFKEVCSYIWDICKNDKDDKNKKSLCKLINSLNKFYSLEILKKYVISVSIKKSKGEDYICKKFDEASILNIFLKKRNSTKELKFSFKRYSSIIEKIELLKELNNDDISLDILNSLEKDFEDLF